MASKQLAIFSLGQFQAQVDGVPARFATDPGRALLAYLAVEADRPHARTYLAFLLWPDQPEAQALNNLRQTLIRLRQLMRVLAKSGQRVAAIQQYETCRRILQDELGIAPSPETTLLYEQIKAGTFGRAANSASNGPGGVGSLDGVVTARRGWDNLPVVNRIYGRQAEMAQLEQWLVHDRCRLISVVGMGGIGKTTLAVATVEKVATHFDLLLWRSLLNAPPLDELLRNWLQLLAADGSSSNLPILPESLDAQLALLLQHLRTRRCLRESKTGALLRQLDGHTDVVMGIAFSPDGQTLVSGGGDQQVCLWDLQSGYIRHRFSGYSQVVTALAFHPSGRMLASSHYDSVVRLWDVHAQAMQQALHGHTRTVNTVAFNAQGTLLASGSDDRRIQVWAISNTGEIRRHALLQGHGRDVSGVVFHPDGKTLVSGSEDQTIALWNLENGQSQRFIHAHEMPVLGVKVSPTGTLMASVTDHTIRLWETERGRLILELSGHTNFMWSLAFSPDGHWLATGGSDGSIALWDVRNPAQATLATTLYGHTDRVFSVAFHPAGNIVAGGSADHTVSVWDMQTHQRIHSLKGHTHWVWALAFSPDGGTLASAGFDETIRLWNSRRGECVAVMHPPGPYTGMDISGVTGISDAERAILRLLGAVER